MNVRPHGGAIESSAAEPTFESVQQPIQGLLVGDDGFDVAPDNCIATRVSTLIQIQSTLPSHILTRSCNIFCGRCIAGFGILAPSSSQPVLRYSRVPNSAAQHPISSGDDVVAPMVRVESGFRRSGPRQAEAVPALPLLPWLPPVVSFGD